MKRLPYKVTIKFAPGIKDVENSQSYFFQNEAEADLFLEGVEAGSGYIEYEISEKAYT